MRETPGAGDVNTRECTYRHVYVNRDDTMRGYICKSKRIAKKIYGNARESDHSREAKENHATPFVAFFDINLAFSICA